MSDCPFCRPDRPELFTTSHAFALFDKYPVSRGHVLVIPIRHVADYFDLDEAEKAACWALVDRVRDHLNAEFQPDGFNIGINCGAAAGQTVWHAHIHVIPRYEGDVAEPRGGVRGDTGAEELLGKLGGCAG